MVGVIVAESPGGPTSTLGSPQDGIHVAVGPFGEEGGEAMTRGVVEWPRWTVGRRGEVRRLGYCR